MASSDATSSSGSPHAASLSGTVVLGLNRFMGLRSQAKAENPHGLELLPVDSSNLCGMLMKQGAKVNAWERRFFALQGATIAHWESEDVARAGDPSTCRGVGLVQSVERWPVGAKKPAQINEKT
eukprot:1681509-Prymnesium_polylepis.1